MRPAAVIIPTYKNILTEHELISLEQCVKILGSYPLFFAAPFGLDTSPIPYIEKFRIINFDKHFFEGLQGYNRLMLSLDFYNSFTSFEYILIYQLDAFVFSDQLSAWTKKGYDYIGAPWVRESKRIFLNVAAKQSIAQAFNLILKNNINKAVGNGGFSLRKTESMLKALQENRLLADAWKANEDYFWAFAAKINKKHLKIPPFNEASLFSFEMYPAELFKLNNEELPFGAHAWNKYDIVFYRPFFAKLGYNI